MKKVSWLYYILLIGILSACESDPQWKAQTLTYTDSFTSSWSSAEVTLNVDEQSNPITQQVELRYSISENFDEEQVIPMERDEQGQWHAKLIGLQDSTLYYVQYRFTPLYLQPATHDASSFRTTPFPAPSVQTKSATDITATTATLNGAAQEGENHDAITERGFYYSLLREGTYERKQVICGTGAGRFSAKIEALRANATYYYVAYAINKHGVAYGDTLQFNTLNPYQQ